MFRLMFSRKWWWTTLLVLGGIGLTIRLGFWQVGRFERNNALADHLASMSTTSSLTLTGGMQPEGLTGMEYRAVEATGFFDTGHQVAVRNQIWAQSWGIEPGYILITPLVFSDGSAVLVDRGWIPLSYNTPASWQEFNVAGPVSVSGIIRLPAVPEMGGEPDPTLAPGESALTILESCRHRTFAGTDTPPAPACIYPARAGSFPGRDAFPRPVDAWPLHRGHECRVCDHVV